MLGGRPGIALIAAASVLLCAAGSRADKKYPSVIYYNNMKVAVSPVDVLLNNGLILSNSGNYEDGLIYLTAVVSSPDFERMENKDSILYVLSQDFASTGDRENAVHYLIPVIRSTTDRTLLRSSVLKGIKYFSQDRDSGLASAIGYGIARMGDVDDDEFNFSAGWFLSLAGYPASATTFLKKVARDPSLVSDAAYLRAVALLKQGDAASAEAIFSELVGDKAIAAGSKIYVLSRLSLARMYYDKGDFRNAMSLYLQIPQTSSYYVDALYEAFWAAQKINDFQGALDIANRLISLRTPSLLKLKAMLQKGYVITELKQYDTATDYFSETIRQYNRAVDILKSVPPPAQLARSRNWVAREIGAYIMQTPVYTRMLGVYAKAMMIYGGLKGMGAYMEDSESALGQDIFLNEKSLRGYSMAIADDRDSLLRLILARHFGDAENKLSLLSAFKDASLAREMLMRYYVTLSFTDLNSLRPAGWEKKQGRPFYVYDPYEGAMALEKGLNEVRALSLDVQQSMASRNNYIGDTSERILSTISSERALLAGINTTLNDLIENKYADASRETKDMDASYHSVAESWFSSASNRTVKDMYTDIAESLTILASQAEVAFIDTRMLSKEAYTERINREYSESEKEVNSITKRYHGVRMQEEKIVGTIPTTTTIEVRRGDQGRLNEYLQALKDRLKGLKAMGEQIQNEK
ncbi:MAG: hypothetical protein M1491_04915 [Deltaproteobacteria bacterium]|nr:hypothetical protein [Deltaproteobacteria bacterium]MCL5277145.1 hypothetical protein [Deltaproteobacteria bacterium]